MSPGDHAQLASKVAAHERDIANLTSAVDSLSRTIAETSDRQWAAIREQGESLTRAIAEQGKNTRQELAELANKFSESRAVSWPLIISVVVAGLSITSLAVTILTIIGSMALEPVERQLDYITEKSGPEKVIYLEGKISELQTQVNLTNQNTLALINLQRKEQGLQTIDMPGFWPPGGAK